MNLRKLQAEQSIDAGNGRDVDAFAIVGEPGDYVVCLLLVRGGRSLGTTSYFPRAPGTAEEVLASFLLQHYAREEAPPEVRVNLELPMPLHWPRRSRTLAPRPMRAGQVDAHFRWRFLARVVLQQEGRQHFFGSPGERG